MTSRHLIVQGILLVTALATVPAPAPAQTAAGEPTSLWTADESLPDHARQLRAAGTYSLIGGMIGQLDPGMYGSESGSLLGVGLSFSMTDRLSVNIPLFLSITQKTESGLAGTYTAGLWSYWMIGELELIVPPYTVFDTGHLIPFVTGGFFTQGGVSGVSVGGGFRTYFGGATRCTAGVGAGLRLDGRALVSNVQGLTPVMVTGALMLNRIRPDPNACRRNR